LGGPYFGERRLDLRFCLQAALSLVAIISFQ
jgi:hypothetical protein